MSAWDGEDGGDMWDTQNFYTASPTARCGRWKGI